MRATLFFTLLFVSLLWAGTAALGQKIAVERPALPRAALERCILPQREKTAPAGQSAARHVPARQAAQPDAIPQPMPAEPVQTACHYRTAYQAFHLIGAAG